MFDHLDVVSTQFVLGLWVLAAVAIGATVYSVLRRKRRRLLRGSALALVALLALTTASADTVNAHFAYLPTVGDVRAAVGGDRQWVDASALAGLSGHRLARAEKRGIVLRVHVPADPGAGFAATTAVAYLPKQYFLDPGQRFPVVYLMHGSPGRPADWFHAGGAGAIGEQLAASGNPAILFAPQLSHDWLDDPECVDGVKQKVESHLFRSVIPLVDTTFRTWSDRSHRIFAGMSAGGYCALNLGLRHRDVVSTVVDLSGYTVPTHSGGLRVLFGPPGPAATQAADANSPKIYAASLPAAPATRVWLDAGTGDHTVVHEMSAIAPVLTARGFDVQWRVRPGGHTYWVWTAALQEALPWALCNQAGHPGHDRSRPGPVR